MHCNAMRGDVMRFNINVSHAHTNYTHLTHVYLFEWMNKIKSTIEKKAAQITCTSTIITATTTATAAGKKFANIHG